jgi:methylenetetrahydrofolate reductase (NADPH)
MRFSTIYEQNDFVLSYELFPPKTDKGMADLETNLQTLLTYSPHFITCTYGAGGSDQGRTLETLATVQKMTDAPVASHLTCVQATQQDLKDYLNQARDQGVDNIVAIRGDVPEGETEFQATEGGFRYGNELAEFIHNEFPDMGIAVGGYPEKHPEARNIFNDVDNLKRKVDAGADIVITQLFYKNESFFNFLDNCAASGVTIPIVPGILPITNYKQVQRISALCGAKLPIGLANALEHHKDDPEGQLEIGIEHAVQQSKELMERGVPGIHFYVLNKCKATAAILDQLNLRH